MSPVFFNIYLEKIFQLALEDDCRRIKATGKPIQNIRYADDTAKVAHNMEDMQILINKLNDIGLRINIGKTKMMGISRYPQEDASLFIKDQQIESVTKFKIFCLCHQRWDYDGEVKLRIGMAKDTFLKLKNT